MAQLTLNPTEEVEGLSEEEKDSLAVGEKMQKAEEELLAGKYKNAEDLEKAYIELQKKLGEPKEEAEVDQVEPEQQQEQQEQVEPEQEKEEPEEDFFENLWNQSQDDKGYDDTTIDKLSKMDPVDVAQAFLDYRALKEDGAQIDQEDVDSIKESVGGSEAYDELTQWAQANLSEDDRNMFDHVIGLGDGPAAYFASQMLLSKYREAVGYEGEMVHGGNPAPDKKDVFRSQAELVRAMSDSRYDKDPAYRQDIAEKLSKSDINF